MSGKPLLEDLVLGLASKTEEAGYGKILLISAGYFVLLALLVFSFFWIVTEPLFGASQKVFQMATANQGSLPNALPIVVFAFVGLIISFFFSFVPLVFAVIYYYLALKIIAINITLKDVMQSVFAISAIPAFSLGVIFIINILFTLIFKRPSSLIVLIVPFVANLLFFLSMDYLIAKSFELSISRRLIIAVIPVLLTIIVAIITSHFLFLPLDTIFTGGTLK